MTCHRSAATVALWRMWWSHDLPPLAIGGDDFVTLRGFAVTAARARTTAARLGAASHPASRENLPVDAQMRGLSYGPNFREGHGRGMLRPTCAVPGQRGDTRQVRLRAPLCWPVCRTVCEGHGDRAVCVCGPHDEQAGQTQLLIALQPGVGTRKNSVWLLCRRPPLAYEECCSTGRSRPTPTPRRDACPWKDHGEISFWFIRCVLGAASSRRLRFRRALVSLARRRAQAPFQRFLTRHPSESTNLNRSA